MINENEGLTITKHENIDSFKLSKLHFQINE